MLSIIVLADRGVHSAAAHGRDHRPPVPRIRLDRDGLDRGLGAGLADARADAVLALHAAREPDEHGRIYRVIEAGFNAHAVVLPAHARHRAAPPARSRSCVFFATMALTAVHGRPDPQGLLPDPGHRPDLGLRRGRAGHRARGDDAPACASSATSCCAIPTSPASARSPAAPAAPRPPIPAASSSCSSRATSASSRPRRSSTGCGRSSPRSRAPTCSCSRRRTSPSAAASSRASFQYTLQDSNIAELNEWSDKLLEKMRTLPQIADVVERSPGECAAAQDHHQPRPGRRASASRRR